MDQTKPFWQSKTLWLQVVGIIAVIVPSTRAIIQEYFAEAGAGWMLINMVLRIVSKDKLSIS